MTKLDIIFNLPTNVGEPQKYILKMQNHCLELFPFKLLQDHKRYINIDELTISLSRCEHDLKFVRNCQTRAADEAFTSIYQCTKCNYQKYIS
jgi:DNA-directed RNA polymerase subunit M/transcription elongation factor TFIIS